MKMTPELALAAQKMQPGVISLGGFFGDDTRDLATILNDQHAACRRLGVTWEAIGQTMEKAAAQAMAGFGCTLTVEGKWEVCADENRGKVSCPFPHPGMYQKTLYTVTNLRTGQTVRYTDLSCHLIKAHGFFQGQGAYFHLAPETLVEVFELERTDDIPPVPVPNAD